MFHFSFDNFISHVGSADRLLTAIMATLLVAVFGLLTGPVGGNANPFLWNIIDRLFGGVARRTYNVQRSPSSLAFRGTIFALAFIVSGAAFGFGAFEIMRRLPLAGFTEPVLLSLTLTGGTVWFSLNKLYHALKEGKKLTKGSYYPIAVSTRSDLNSTDDYGIARVGIGFMAVSFDKALVAPLFWYLIGGLPLAYLYAGIAASRWALAKDGFAKGLGDTSLWLERIFGFIPYVIAGVLMTFAALFTPGAQLSRAVPGLLKSKGQASYAEGGVLVTIVAWAMKISLGGPVIDLDGSTLKKSWVGAPDATAKVDKSHLRRAIYMSVMAYILLVATLLGGIVLHHLAALV